MTDGEPEVPRGEGTCFVFSCLYMGRREFPGLQPSCSLHTIGLCPKDTLPEPGVLHPAHRPPEEPLPVTRRTQHRIKHTQPQEGMGRPRLLSRQLPGPLALTNLRWSRASGIAQTKQLRAQAGYDCGRLNTNHTREFCLHHSKIPRQCLTMFEPGLELAFPQLLLEHQVCEMFINFMFKKC